MTDATIRPADPDTDAAAVAALVTGEYEFILQDADSIRHRLADDGPGKRRLALVAEADGAIVAMADTALDPENSRVGAANANMVVAAEHRRTGIGSALIDRLERHWEEIGATAVTARVIREAGIDFAEKRGFARSRTERISHVSLADIPAPVPPAEGIVLKTLAELPDARAMYALDTLVTADIPADEPWQTLPYEEWAEQYLSDPRLDREDTVLAFDGDTAVALAWLDRVGTRVWSGLTGTHPDHRGRGLAKVVKTAALHRAREHGAVDAYTNNDATNAGMLAVNTWLGYRLYTEQYTYVRNQ